MKTRHRRSLEERQAEMKVRTLEKIPINPKYANPDLLRQRLCVIKDAMGQTVPVFAAMMGMGTAYAHAMLYDHKRRPTFTMLYLAEEKFRRFLRREVRRNKVTKATKRVESVDLSHLDNMDEIRTKVVGMFCSGMPVSEIGEKLALRPEVVKHFTKGIR